MDNLESSPKNSMFLRTLRQVHPRWFIVASVGVLLTIILYKSAFAWLIGIWSNDKDYSHGFLIMPICVYLAWIMRDRVETVHAAPCLTAGGAVMLASAALLIAGRAGGIVLAEAVSFLLLVPGIVLFAWGWDAVKAFALPLAYLQFMVPWMEEFIRRMHGPFQLMSAHIGVWILNVIGIAVYQEGKFIMLPNATLEVAQTCSGVRYLTSVVALGIPLVYLTQRNWWRAFGVIGAGVGITALTNGARVGFVGYMTYHYGLGLSHGPFHVFQGWFAAQIGFVVLFLVNWAIGRIPSGDAVCLYDRWKAKLRTRQDGAREFASPLLPLMLAIVFLAGIGAYLHWFGSPVPRPTRQPLGLFPSRVANWSGTDIAWIHGDTFFPGADAEISRSYRNPDGREVHLYVAYFETQRQGKSLISFRSNPLRKEVREVALPLFPPVPRSVNHSILTAGRIRYSVLYWYRFPTGETTGRIQTKLKSVTDALYSRKNGGAIVLVAIPASGMPVNKKEIPPEMIAFVGDVAPILRDYLP